MKPSDRITFQKQQNYSTLIGRMTSWILIGIYLAVFMNFGNNMIYRNNPQSIFSQIVTPDPVNLNLDQLGFFMAFGLQDLRNGSAHYIDDSIYRVEVVQRIKTNGNISLKNIPIGKCQLENVPDRDDLKAYYQRNHITDLLCIKNDSHIKPELKSTWDGEYYKNILINIYPCINTTNNRNLCRPAEDIQTYLNSANFAIYFNTEAIDPNNFEKPITSYGKQLYTPISFSTLTYIEMLFGHFNFITDIGFLFETLDVVESANYLANRQVLSFSSNMMVQIDMKLDKIKTIYTRKYDKIQNVLADIGGIIKALMIFSNLLVLPFIKLNFRLNLANSIFTFSIEQTAQNILKKVKKEGDDDLKLKSTSLKSQRNQTKLEIPKEFNKKNKTNTEIKETKKNIKNEKKSNENKSYLRSPTEKVQISYSRYFMNCFNNPSSLKAKKMLKKGLNQIDQVLDISYIMKKLVEIDLLKLLLLNKNQNNLFESVPKPIIGLDLEDKNYMEKSLLQHFSVNFSKSPNNKAKEALNSFELIMRQNPKSQIDRKLLNMMSSTRERKEIKKSTFLQCSSSRKHGSNLKLYEVQNDIILFDEENDKELTNKEM